MGQSARIGRITLLGFPKNDLFDRKPEILYFFEDNSGQIFRSRIGRKHDDWFAALSERLNKRIGLGKQGPVVEFVFQPLADRAFQIAEVDDHTASAECFAAQRDPDRRIVAVQARAFPAVLQKPMGVTEVEIAGNRVHEGNREQGTGEDSREGFRFLNEVDTQL